MKKLQQELEEAKLMTWFCPQINATCNQACYCFIQAKTENRDGVNMVKQSYCIHALHQEEMEINARVQL